MYRNRLSAAPTTPVTLPPPTQAVVLAGGLGTRLGSLTEKCPKPLLPVGTRPFLSLLLNELVRFGIEDIIISAGYLGERFQEAYHEWRPRSGHSCSVRVVIEPEALGTGGALRFLRDQLAPGFLVLNGDSWFDIDWVDFIHRPLEPSYKARLALRAVEEADRYGSVDRRGDRVLGFHEKGRAGPGLINGGVYLFDRSALDAIGPGNRSLEHDLLPQLAARGLLSGRRYDGFFLDIGTPESFAHAQREIPDRQRRPILILPARDFLVLLKYLPNALRQIRNRNYYLFLVDLEDDLNTQGLINRQLANAGGVCDRILTAADCAQLDHSPAGQTLFDDWGGLQQGSCMISSSAVDTDLAQSIGVPFRQVDADRLADAILCLPDASRFARWPPAHSPTIK